MAEVGEREDALMRLERRWGHLMAAKTERDTEDAERTERNDAGRR